MGSESNFWTVVQHSGYGYGFKPEFEHGLESRVLESKEEVELVRKEGGCLFDNYGEAEEFALNESYPETGEFYLIPNAPGSFSNKEIDELAIYLPKAADVQVS